MLKVLRAGLLSSTALLLVSGSAFAADLGGSFKDEPAATPDYSIAVNGGFMTDYVFRGISQNDNDPSLFAGVDLTYQMFYLGVWGAAVDDGVSAGNTEIDVYGGIKPKYAGIDFDFGLIYYGYPSQRDAANVYAADYLEVKAAASATILNDLAVTGTVFWSPDYALETGSTWTVEGKVSKPLPIAELVLSGALGYVTSDDDSGQFSGSFGDDNYTYWNVGLSRTFKEHYTFDVRYWGTDVDTNDRHLDALADDRVVGTFTFSY
jgi:uncharacterized protein (TIGR02001 family)